MPDDLTELPIDELIQQMHDDLYDGMAEQVEAEVHELLRRGWTPYEALTKGLVGGMDIVGVDFRDGILFVPEVLMAAKAMKAGMAILRPLLAETGAPQIGTMVIGTVKGDIHDIGKNLVAMMMEGAGFKVVNLGINNDAEKFIAAIHEHQPEILGMSALLTTTMPYMQVVIQALKEQSLRDKVIVLVGGAPLNAAFAEEIEADAYCRDAAVAVETAKKLIAIRRGGDVVIPAQPRERARDRRRQAAQAGAAIPVAPGGLPGGQYQPLTPDQVARIQAAALTVLAETGVEVMPSPCRDVWQRAGARIDAERNRVYVPAALVEQALATAARSVRLCGQSPEFDLELSGSRVYLGTGGAAVKVLDLDGQVRPSRLRDIYDIGRLVDTLDHIHFYLRPVVARDLSNELLDVNTYYAALASTRKHVMGNSFTAQSVREVLRLAALIAGSEEALRDRPFISWTNCWIVSPLRFAPETVAVLDEIVASGLPVAISSAPQAGATAPVTLAGTLVQLTAEQLAGITYINLLHPGHPVLLGYVPSVADLRTGSFTGGSAEFALMNAAAAQLAHAYGLPVYNSSALSDSKVPDVQAGYEKGMSTVTAALAGANFIHHSAGFLESLLAVAYEQYVIDDDINGAVMRMVRGIEVTDETLAVGVIDEVCRGEGHFLGHPQTLANMNTEYYYPHTADRTSRDAWEAAGSLDMRQRARQRASDVLARHWPTHLSAEVDAAIRAEFDIRLPLDQMRGPVGAAPC